MRHPGLPDRAEPGDAFGYLNIDTVISPDSLDESAFLEMEIEEQTDYVTVYRSPKDIIAFIDRNTSRAVAGI